MKPLHCNTKSSLTRLLMCSSSVAAKKTRDLTFVNAHKVPALTRWFICILLLLLTHSWCLTQLLPLASYVTEKTTSPSFFLFSFFLFLLLLLFFFLFLFFLFFCTRQRALLTMFQTLFSGFFSLISCKEWMASKPKLKRFIFYFMWERMWAGGRGRGRIRLPAEQGAQTGVGGRPSAPSRTPASWPQADTQPTEPARRPGTKFLKAVII